MHTSYPVHLKSFPFPWCQAPQCQCWQKPCWWHIPNDLRIDICKDDIYYISNTFTCWVSTYKLKRHISTIIWQKPRQCNADVSKDAQRCAQDSEMEKWIFYTLETLDLVRSNSWTWAVVRFSTFLSSSFLFSPMDDGGAKYQMFLGVEKWKWKC